MIKLNMNAMVRFRLKENFKPIIENYAWIIDSEKVPDKNGWYRLLLWRYLQIFTSQYEMWLDPPTIDNEIYIEDSYEVQEEVQHG